MSRSDSRAVAEFLWAAAEGRDIVLKSDGLKERSHCYVADAVQGLLAALEKGESGQAYNIADRRYQMTIRAFAEQAAEAGGCRVVLICQAIWKAEAIPGFPDKCWMRGSWKGWGGSRVIP